MLKAKLNIDDGEGNSEGRREIVRKEEKGQIRKVKRRKEREREKEGDGYREGEGRKRESQRE